MALREARFSDSLKFDFDSEAQIREWRTKPIHYEKNFAIASGAIQLYAGHRSREGDDAA